MAGSKPENAAEWQQKMQAARKGAKQKVPGSLKLLRDIRRYCLECCCGQPSEVEKCVSRKCILFPHRMGVLGYKEPDRFDLEGGEGYLGGEDGQST